MRTRTIALAALLTLVTGACSLANDEPSSPSSAAITTGAPTGPSGATGVTGGDGSSGGPQSGCTQAEAVDLTDDEAAELEIEDFAYHPACATIAKGQALEIRNRDNFSHTFTVDALNITIPIDGDATITMANRGKEPKLAVGPNPFHCSIHPEMTGTIFVTG
ncbi:MAG TPA: cupredoxin domain-containing protein [Actinomycetota bacterium]|jgi:plastocyanin|nr:cupredoxin domain-containing protein [Actinomycetota bacterium]